MPQEPKYVAIVRPKAGLIIRNRPGAQSDGAAAVRTEPVGKQLMVYNILQVGPVKYAQIVPQDPLKPEWARVAEADNSVVYLDVYPIEDTSGPAGAILQLAAAINRLADVLEKRS